MRHKGNAKQSGNSRVFTWYFSHAFGHRLFFFSESVAAPTLLSLTEWMHGYGPTRVEIHRQDRREGSRCFCGFTSFPNIFVCYDLAFWFKSSWLIFFFMKRRIQRDMWVMFFHLKASKLLLLNAWFYRCISVFMRHLNFVNLGARSPLLILKLQWSTTRSWSLLWWWWRRR